MTSLAQVTALVDAHVRRDDARFRAVALAVAANLASRSERGAEHLRKLVDRPPSCSLVMPSASGLLSAPPDLSTLDDMVLAPAIRGRLDRVVLEHTRRAELLASELRPARKLLFSGPPGCGKSMGAGALAIAIGLPLFRVELHGVISSHLGETAGKLAKVFEHVRSIPGVYLFDEFDAISTERSSLGGEAAGAEMRRVVNSLLQFVEDDRSESLIIAATNHAQMLDHAIFRRFDEVIAFEPPTREEVVELFRRALDAADVERLDLDRVCAVAMNLYLGHADVCAAVVRVRKDYVLEGISVDSFRLSSALAARVALGKKDAS